jgi:GntR family transcriptional regulator/MocR family aminotransferase
MAKISQLIAIALAPKPPGESLAKWLYDEIRRAILEGRLKRGARLPATREFAKQYRVSRRTAVAVFEQLQAEGYVTSRVGSGTTVNEQLPEDLLEQPARLRHAEKPRPAPPAERFGRPARPFRPIEPALSEFPADLWARVASRRLRRISPSLLAGGNLAGYAPLREAIASYLAASRDVNCSSEQVVVVSGIQQGIDLVARLLLEKDDPVWIEDPAYPGAADALRMSGARLIPVRVDERGIDPQRGRSLCPKARLAYVTPAHQFALGWTMTLERRLALLAWAGEAGASIFEDDYDSEYRFAGRPLPALQGLDRWNRVIFAGSFNKVLFSSLRLGYLVVPDRLVDPLLRLRYQTDRYPPGLSQAILCDFIAEGHFGRHLRRMRELYARRLEALRDSARRYLGGLLEIPEIEAGLNTPAYLTNGMSGRQAEAIAGEHGVEAIAIDRFALQRRDLRGLLLGFAAFTESEIRQGAIKLASAFEGAGKRGAI